MESAFAIIAEPNRRAILSMLASSERSVGEIDELRLPQPSVSKHLRVLREAGFVESRVKPSGASIGSGPSRSWSSTRGSVPFRRFWSKHVDALERHLDRMDKRSSVKGRKRHEQR